MVLCAEHGRCKTTPFWVQRRTGSSTESQWQVARKRWRQCGGYQPASHPPLDVVFGALAVAQEGGAQRAQLVQDAPQRPDVCTQGRVRASCLSAAMAGKCVVQRYTAPRPRIASSMAQTGSQCSGLTTEQPLNTNIVPTCRVRVGLAVPHLRGHVVRGANLQAEHATRGQAGYAWQGRKAMRRQTACHARTSLQLQAAHETPLRCAAARMRYTTEPPKPGTGQQSGAPARL